MFAEVLKNYLSTIAPIEEEVLLRFSSIFTERSLSKNEYFAKRGELSQEVGFLTQGVVRAFYLNEQGKEYNKQFFVGPSIIGAYTSLITKQPNLIPQQALTDCQVFVARYEEIEKLYQTYHSLEHLGRKIAEYYFLEKENKELEMGLMDADQRYKILQNTFPGIEQEIPQYHIASYLGITPTQLSRIRKK